MKPVVAFAVAAVAFGGARVARGVAERERPRMIEEEPFAPSPTAAPIVVLGYRQVAADLLSLRLTGYFGGSDSTARGLGALVDSIVALDPHLHKVYEYGARAMTMAAHDVDQGTYLHAIEILKKGMDAFPDDWKLPYLAGQIYTQDLKPKDTQERRDFDEKGTLLIESAIRKPGAPAEAAEWAAVMRTRLGQHERAVSELREMLLVTSDEKARQRLIDRLAQLEAADRDAIAAEIAEQRRRFEDAWKRDRPDVPPTIYVLIGPKLAPGFDLGDLATGGRDVIGTDEKPEP